MAGVSLLTRLCDLTNLRMMMKKLIYMVVLLFAAISVKAQDYEAFNKFMRDSFQRLDDRLQETGRQHDGDD